MWCRAFAFGNLVSYEILVASHQRDHTITFGPSSGMGRPADLKDHVSHHRLKRLGFFRGMGADCVGTVRAAYFLQLSGMMDGYFSCRER